MVCGGCKSENIYYKNILKQILVYYQNQATNNLNQCAGTILARETPTSITPQFMTLKVQNSSHDTLKLYRK